jgi:predicted esterase
MIEQEVSFNYKARYYKLGTLSAETKKVWFVIHGYGQLAQYFLKKFNSLLNSEICIIAPEGLSRFYLEDITNRSRSGNNKVGATWMTKENRLTDIRNYITYLNEIYTHEIPAGFTGEITLLGFSQGAATVSRWALDGSINFQRLVLWAGIFPPDMDFHKGSDLFKSKEVIEVFGKQDPYLTDDRLKEMTQLNERLGLTPKIIHFEGGHEINTEILAQLH